MSQFRVQVMYSGEGPRKGQWLNAYEQAGFAVNDKHPTAELAQAELARLRGMGLQFQAEGTDWHLRVHEEGSPEREVVPTSKPASRDDETKKIDAASLVPKKKAAKKKVAKKKAKKATE